MNSKQTLHIFTCESLDASSDPVLDPPDCPPDTENGLTGVDVVQVVDGHQLLVTQHGTAAPRLVLPITRTDAEIFKP